MAIVAVVAAANVCGMLTSCRDAIVTRAASPHYLRVVDRKDRGPHSRRMTVLAKIACLYMQQVFARGFNTVVATLAVVGDAYVIKVCRSPSCCCVAVIACITARYMCRVFTSCCQAVVARIAGANYLGVINGENGYPDIRGVAILADVACLQMCLALTRGFDAIVTAEAVSGDVYVIEIGGQPGDG